NHGVTADKSNRRIPRPDRDRKIERGDAADGAERMPLLEHAVIGPLAGNRQAVKLPREADGEVAHVDHLLDFAETFALDLSTFQRDEHSQIVFRLAQRLADLTDNVASLRRWNNTPFVENSQRRLDRLFIAGLVRRDHATQRFTRRRVERDAFIASRLLNPP